MDASQAREMLAEAERHHVAGEFAQAETLYRSLITGLSRDPSRRNQRIRAYDHLVDVKYRKRDFPGALRVFQEYLGDCAPACDKTFDQLYTDGLAATLTSPSPLRRRQRFFSLANLLQSLPPLAGLVAECGCCLGLSSYVLCGYLKLADSRFDGRGYRIFDSFAGLSEPREEDAFQETDSQAAMFRSMRKQGSYAATLGEVKRALHRYPGIEYYPGWIPDAFPDEPDARYRFVHVDVDLYQPTRDSLEYFYPRLVPGGMIVCDDYNWPGARKAIEEYCARANARFSPTPYHQAYIVRRA